MHQALWELPQTAMWPDGCCLRWFLSPSLLPPTPVLLPLPAVVLLQQVDGQPHCCCVPGPAAPRGDQAAVTGCR
jgi:hypothetical protein